MRSMLVTLIAVATLTGCGSVNLARYRDGISANQQALGNLELGMSQDEASQVMGQGVVVRYKRLYLVDPWRSESFALEDGTEVLLLFYITEFPRRYARSYDRALTPLVFETGILVGWGWSYLNRNLDRYQVKAPLPQH